MPLLLNLLPARFLLTLREWFDYKISHCVISSFAIQYQNIHTIQYPIHGLISKFIIQYLSPSHYPISYSPSNIPPLQSPVPSDQLTSDKSKTSLHTYSPIHRSHGLLVVIVSVCLMFVFIQKCFQCLCYAEKFQMFISTKKNMFSFQRENQCLCYFFFIGCLL